MARMQSTLDFPRPVTPERQIDHGIVYTRPWVVRLILDLSGYTVEQDLGASVLMEPSCGSGEFLEEAVRRLVESCQRHSRDVTSCTQAIVAFDLMESAVLESRQRILGVLEGLGVDAGPAKSLVRAWIRQADFLLSEAASHEAPDFIVGNPPYVRIESVAEEVLAQYRARFSSMKGRADLYVPFFERALSLLKPGGACGFICSDRWMLNQYGAKLRSIVTGRYSVEAVVEMHTADAFLSDVLAYPAVTIIRAKAQSDSTLVARASSPLTDEQAMTVTRALQGMAEGRLYGVEWASIQGWYTGEQPWPCASPARLQLLRDLESRFPTIGEEGIAVGIGVATGADSVFITKDADKAEADRMLPLAFPRDAFSGELVWSGHYLLNPWDHSGKLVDLAKYPRLAGHFEEHRSQLARRHTARKASAHWYKTIDNVHPWLRGRRKLLIPDIKGRLHPVLDEGTVYPHHNLYYMVTDTWPVEALGGLLLSDVAQFFIDSYAVRMAGGFFRFQAQYLRRIRVPRLADVSDKDLAALSAAFASRDVLAANRTAFQLYGIDEIPE